MSRPRARDERGAVALLVGIMSLVIFTIAALVVDLGNGRDQRRQAQNAADAAALAGANELYIHTFAETPRITEAVAAVKAYALNNYRIQSSAWSGCTDPDKLAYVPPSSTDCISFNQSAKPTTVRVRLPKTQVGTYFAKVIGVQNIDVGAKAHASLVADGAIPCALCVLGPGLHNLQNGDAFVTNGDVDFNGSVSVSANGLVVTNGTIKVQGTASGPLDNYTPDPITGVPGVIDPFRHLSLPPIWSALSARSNPCTDGPGLYGSYNFPNGTCTLQPGLYVIAGGSSTTWALSGNTVLAGSGVSLYFTCGSASAPRTCNAPTEAGANIDASGNGLLSIQAPTSGALKGLAVIYDRLNNGTFQLNGNGASSTSGSFYMASGTLQMGGNGCAAITTQIVVSDISMNGNPACLRMTYAAGAAPDQVPKLFLSR